MANVKLIFNGTRSSETHDVNLECFIIDSNEIFISIDEQNHICLDKSTAIKLAKTLRTEINKMQEEGHNG